MRPLDAVLVALAGLALAWTGVQAVRSAREAGRRERSAAAARQDLDTTRARLAALESQRLDSTIARQTLLTLDAPPPQVVAALAELLPEDVRLESMLLRYGDRLELEMRVVARSSTAYDVFLERLSSSPRFESVLPGEENRDGEVRAGIKAAYRGGLS
jgi:hypothetical protein